MSQVGIVPMLVSDLNFFPQFSSNMSTIVRTTGIEAPICDQETVTAALEKDDLSTLVRYPYLYPWLRHTYPLREYNKALISAATVEAFQEYVYMNPRQVNLPRIRYAAKRNPDPRLFTYLQKLFPE